MTLYYERFSESVATGTQTLTLALTKGTNRRIISVYVYMPGAADSAFFEVHRTNGTPSSSTIIGETSYNASTFVDTEDPQSTTSLKVKISTGLGTTATCYFTVVYDYV